MNAYTCASMYKGKQNTLAMKWGILWGNKKKKNSGYKDKCVTFGNGSVKINTSPWSTSSYTYQN